MSQSCIIQRVATNQQIAPFFESQGVITKEILLYTNIQMAIHLT